MNKILIIARHEFRSLWSRLSFLILTAIFPILAVGVLLGVFIYQAAFKKETIPVQTTFGYVDNAGFLTGFQKQGNVTFKPYQDQQEAVQALLDNKIKALFVVPSNYLNSGVVTQVKEQRPGIPMTSESNAALENFLVDNLLANKLPANIIARARSPLTLSVQEISSSGEPVQIPFDYSRFVFFMVLGVLVIMSAFSVSSYLLQSLSDEKENRVMEILLSSVTPDQLMLGKLLGIGAAGLAQFSIWVASGIVVALLFRSAGLNLPSISLPTPGLVMIGVLYFILSYSFFAALMGALAAVSNTQKEANQITVLVTMPGIVPFWLLTPILEHPDQLLARALSFIPFTAPVTSMARLGMKAMGPADLLISMGILLLSTALVILLSLRIFRAYLLMYGRRPNVREILVTLFKG